MRGFWLLTLYNEHHFFAPNDIARYSVGTKNKDLVPEADGALTIFIQTGAPDDPHQRANWLPAPEDADFSLFVRAYWPDEKVVTGDWTPPAVCEQPSVEVCRAESTDREWTRLEPLLPGSTSTG